MTRTAVRGCAGAPCASRAPRHQHAGSPPSAFGAPRTHAPCSSALELRRTTRGSRGCRKKCPRGGESTRVRGCDVASFLAPAGKPRATPPHPVTGESGGPCAAPAPANARREPRDRARPAKPVPIPAPPRGERQGRGSPREQAVYISLTRTN